MSDKKYINKTVYTKKYFKEISAFNNLVGAGFYLMCLFIAFCLFTGYRAIGKGNLIGWINICIGLCVIPVYTWLLPTISANKNFKEIEKMADGRQPLCTTEFSDRIYSKNSLGRANNQTYENIKSMTEFKNLFHIEYKNKSSMYLEISGFKTGEYIKVKELLIQKTGLKIKDENR